MPRPSAEERFTNPDNRNLWVALPEDMQSRIVELRRSMMRFGRAPSLETFVNVWRDQCPEESVGAVCAITGAPLRYRGVFQPKLWKRDHERGWTGANMQYVCKIMYELLRTYKMPSEYVLPLVAADIITLSERLSERGFASEVQPHQDEARSAPAGQEEPQEQQQLNPWNLTANVAEARRRGVIESSE